MAGLRISQTLERLLASDFCPWANRYVYWLKTPLGVLSAAALVALVSAIFIGAQAWILLAALVMATVLGVVWPWLSMRGIACEVSFDEARAIEGRNVGAVLVVHNRWPWPVWGLAIEGGLAPRDEHGDGTAVSLARVAGWSRSEFRWSFRPLCRGRYPTAAPRISTEFPLGLWKARKPVAVAGSVVVWPQTVALVSHPLPQGRRLAVASPSDFRAGDEGEHSGVRPFRQGDTLRGVHWRLSAKLDRLIVNERQGSAQSLARVVVDPGTFAASPGGASDVGAAGSGDPDSAWEWALRLAASICLSFIEDNAETRLVIGGQSVLASRGVIGTRRLLDFLATFDAASAPQRTQECASRDRRSPSEFEVSILGPHAGAVPSGRRSDAPRPKRGRGRCIVIEHAAHQPHDELDADCEAFDSHAVIALSAPVDPFGQLRRAWRSWSQEVWRGAR